MRCVHRFYTGYKSHSRIHLSQSIVYYCVYYIYNINKEPLIKLKRLICEVSWEEIQHIRTNNVVMNCVIIIGDLILCVLIFVSVSKLWIYRYCLSLIICYAPLSNVDPFDVHNIVHKWYIKGYIHLVLCLISALKACFFLTDRCYKIYILYT